jgi:hypothetical protein
MWAVLDAKCPSQPSTACRPTPWCGGDVIVSDTEGEGDAAESALAAIRQSLRQGTMVTRQITRL